MEKLKDILKNIKKIEINTKKAVEGLLSGEYRSAFKGRGIEFSEVREYVPGDDVRVIDWNVTARFNMPFVKEFIEERNLDVYIVFDVSASGEFGYEKSKKEVGIEAVASIMFSALKNNDNVALCLFTEKVEKYIPLGKGKKHILRILEELIRFNSESKGTNVGRALAYMSKIARRRGIIFVISDFISPEFEKEIKILKNRHDVILINLLDMREEELPDIGYILLEDEETGEQIFVNTRDENFRKFYSYKVRERRKEFYKSMKRLGIDVVELRTDRPFYVALKRFFEFRKRRMRA